MFHKRPLGKEQSLSHSLESSLWPGFSLHLLPLLALPALLSKVKATPYHISRLAVSRSRGCTWMASLGFPLEWPSPGSLLLILQSLRVNDLQEAFPSPSKLGLFPVLSQHLTITPFLEFSTLYCNNLIPILFSPRRLSLLWRHFI